MQDFGAVGIVLILFYLAIIAVAIASYWKIFEKAGQPGWAALIPFYNTYVLIVEVLKMPPVWFWLLLVPCVGSVVGLILVFMIPFKLAEKFGKDAGFAIGLLLLGIIFLPILAFGDAQYQSGRKRYADDYDDEEEDERPRKKKRDEDDEDDDRPRKKKRDDNW
jgi:uncharacterized membrane protein YhaH (DUF805 family)